jgi:uncharacterized membrane protein
MMQSLSSKNALFLILLSIALAACSGKTPTPTLPPSPTTAPPAAPTATPLLVAVDPAGSSVTFSQDVLPIFEARCTKCHGATRQSSGLALNTYAVALAGSSAGPVIIPQDATNSKLVEVITKGIMPKNGTKLTHAEVQIISDWINAGAPDN